MTIPTNPVAEAFEPSDSDWVISILYADGTLRNRRISPGRITEEQAIRFALASDRRPISDAVRIEARRASDRRIVTDSADGFLERLRRIKA